MHWRGTKPDLSRRGASIEGVKGARIGGCESTTVAPAWGIREGFLEEVTSKLEKVGNPNHVPERRNNMNRSQEVGGAWKALPVRWEMRHVGEQKETHNNRLLHFSSSWMLGVWVCLILDIENLLCAGLGLRTLSALISWVES